MPLEQADNLSFKEIRLELLSRSTAGVIRAELHEEPSYICLFRVPRAYFDNWRNSAPEARFKSIYFLTWTDRNSGNPCIYVGQTEATAMRFPHHQHSDSWGTAYILTTKKTTSQKFSLDDLAYLENVFYEAAREADAYECKNGVTPRSSDSPQAWVKRSTTMVEVFALLEALGCTAFRKAMAPVEEETSTLLSQTSRSQSTPALALREPPSNHPTTMRASTAWTHGLLLRNGIKACAIWDGRPGTTTSVLAGAIVAKENTSSSPRASPAAQEALAHLAPHPTEGNLAILQKTISFTSPSAAAGFVTGRSTSGIDAWQEKRTFNRSDRAELMALITAPAAPHSNALSPTHYYKGRNGVYARLNIAEDGKATLLKGSIIIKHPTESDKPVVAELIEKRNERARDLADNDEHTLRVVNDISFDSRNQAVRFIVCNSINAREKLKTYRPRNRHD